MSVASVTNMRYDYIARILWLILLSPMHCQIMLRWVMSCRHFTSVSKATAPNIKFWFKRTRYFCSLIVEFPINLLNCWVPYHLSWNHESLKRYFPPLIWLERASECWCVQWNHSAVALIVKPMNRDRHHDETGAGLVTAMMMLMIAIIYGQYLRICIIM